MDTPLNRPSYGGNRLHVRCPQCNFRLMLIDRQFMQFGPIRCGACGSEIKGSLVARALQEAALERSPNR